MPKGSDTKMRGNPTGSKINGATFPKNSLLVILFFTKGLGAKPISASWTEDDEPRITSKKYSTTRTSKTVRMVAIADYSTSSNSDALIMEAFLAGFLPESMRKSLFEILVAVLAKCIMIDKKGGCFYISSLILREKRSQYD